MSGIGVAESVGWYATGFVAAIVLWAWVAAVLLFGLWRSIYQPAADPLRSAGPGID